MLVPHQICILVAKIYCTDSHTSIFWNWTLCPTSGSTKILSSFWDTKRPV